MRVKEGNQFNMKKHLKSLLFLFSILFVLFPLVPEASAEPIDVIRGVVDEYYVDEVPDAVLLKGTIKEITDSLDPHSVYMTAEEYQRFINGIEQRIVGVGIVLEEDLKGIKVISVIPNGPAERAGIQPGDVITHVDGRNIVGDSVQTAVSIISGKENTTVTLTLDRKSQILSKTITREVINLPNVEYKMLGGNIGYIRLNSFSTESTKEIDKAIQALEGAKGWIMDLRNNGGGYITSAQEISGFFPTVNKAFQLRYKNRQPITYDAISQTKKLSQPSHLLINEYSASASEMVAAAVKEQQGAVLYGQTSYGKGTMQNTFSLTDGSVLKLTTARFYSPNGLAIDKVGVNPHIVTEKGAELEVSHRDQLIASLKGYKQLPELRDVPVTKKFTVQMNTNMKWNDSNAAAVQLIQLGGGESEVSVKVIDNKTLTIVPKNPLESGKKYILVINPLWKGQNSSLMKQGIYLEVSIK